MTSPIELNTVETYRGIPIVELTYPEPVLLTETTHREQIEALLEHPAERLAVIISYNNISCSNQYGPEEQAALFDSGLFRRFQERAVCLIRYHARSLTALVSTMSAHALLRAGASNFAPDLDTAVRAARRSIDGALAREESPAEHATRTV